MSLTLHPTQTDPGCHAVCVVADYKPNPLYLTEHPQPVSQTPLFCCNDERKARRRVTYASTNLKKNYFTTMQEYRQNRCQTFDQRAFNFQTSGPSGPTSGPAGSPTALGDLYVANCQPTGLIAQASVQASVSAFVSLVEGQVPGLSPAVLATLAAAPTPQAALQAIPLLPVPLPTQQAIGAVYNLYYGNPYTNPYLNDSGVAPTNLATACARVVYKPNNYQFAKQGAVSSSTLMLKRNVTTIETNLAGYNRDMLRGTQLGLQNSLTANGQPAIPFLYKNKIQGCNAEVQRRFQNHRSCDNTGGVAPL